MARLLLGRGLVAGPTESDEQPSLLVLVAAASAQGKCALPSEGGPPVQRIGEPVEIGEPGPARLKASRCAERGGVSLHAAVAVPARESERLGHLCMHVARTSLAMGRLSLSRRGKVILRLRKPWRDGTTYLCFEPLVFLERLAAPGRLDPPISRIGDARLP